MRGARPRRARALRAPRRASVTDGARSTPARVVHRDGARVRGRRAPDGSEHRGARRLARVGGGAPRCAKASHVVLGDAPLRPGGAHVAQVDAQVARELAGRGGRERLGVEVRPPPRRGALFAPAAGVAVRPHARERLAMSPTAVAAGLVFRVGDGRGASALAPRPPRSNTTSTECTFTTCPTSRAARRSFPPSGDVMVTVALSVITSTIGWSSFTTSPALHVPGDDLALGHALADVRKLEFPAAHRLSLSGAVSP
jgi:hypothetical protein